MGRRLVMTATLWTRLFRHETHHVAGFHQELDAVLPATGRVLDLGCGVNTDLAPYRSARREVWGTDFEVHPLLEYPQWFRALGEDGTIPFPDAHFDAVTCVMVLEHVAEPAPFFAEVARVLRPGGYFVGHSISGLHYVTWLRRLFGLLPHRWNQIIVERLYGRAGIDTFPAYYRLNRVGQLRQASRGSGLQLQGVRRYADPGYFQFCRPLLDTAIVTDRVLEEIGPGWGRLYFTATFRKTAVSQRVPLAA
jgi:SAM-dependent methyltransferase